MIKIEERDLKFIECDACAAKPGTPMLCAGCLQNRLVIEQLKRERDEARAARVDAMARQYRKSLELCRKLQGELVAAEALGAGALMALRSLDPELAAQLETTAALPI